MEEPTKHCPYCDEVIRMNAVKCKHCGTALDPVAPIPVVDTITEVRAALSHKYTIIEEVGRGGMSIVYKALQKNLDRIVALKVLPRNLVHDLELVDRFHREARAIARLSHPHIVAIFDEGVENQIHFMAMEFLEGIDLHALVQQKKRLDVGETVSAVMAVADALDFAHAHDIIHRDVKTSNIILTKEGRAVLTDFGIAHAEAGSQLTLTGTVLGTPEFMSPEQASGVPVDARSDLYSLGIVLYECVTGDVPFRGDNPLTTISRILNETPTPASSFVPVPLWIDYAISKCLEKDPDKRVQSGKELIQILREQRTPPGFATRIRMMIKRGGKRNLSPRRANRMLSLVVALLVFLISVLIMLLLNQRQQSGKASSSQADQVVAPSVLLPNGGRPGSVPARTPGPPGVKTIPGSRVSLPMKQRDTIEVATIVQVPDLSNLTEEEARDRLWKAQLKTGRVSRWSAGPDQVGRVVRQLPKPASNVKRGAEVAIYIGE